DRISARDPRFIAPEHMRVAVGKNIAAIETDIGHTPAGAHSYRRHARSRGRDGLLDASYGPLQTFGARRVGGAGVRMRGMKDDFVDSLRAHRGADLLDIRRIEWEHQVECNQRDRSLTVADRQRPGLDGVEYTLGNAFSGAISRHRDAGRRIEVRSGRAGAKHVRAVCATTEKQRGG